MHAVTILTAGHGNRLRVNHQAGFRIESETGPGHGADALESHLRRADNGCRLRFAQNHCVKGKSKLIPALTRPCCGSGMIEQLVGRQFERTGQVIFQYLGAQLRSFQNIACAQQSGRVRGREQQFILESKCSGDRLRNLGKACLPCAFQRRKQIVESFLLTDSIRIQCRVPHRGGQQGVYDGQATQVADRELARSARQLISPFFS